MTLLSEEEIEEKMLQLQDWEVEEGDSMIITKNFEFNNYDEAIDFVNKIRDVANEQDHHPDLLIYGYKYVEIMLTTHDFGGITQRDIDCAIAIDSIDN